MKPTTKKTKNKTTEHLFIISKENKELARKEIEKLLNIKTRKTKNNNNLTTKQTINKKLMTRLAFTKEIHQIIIKGTTKQTITKLNQINKKNFLKKNETTKITLLREEKNFDALTKEEAYKKTLNWLGNPKVSLKNPSKEYCLIQQQKKLLLTKIIWKNPGGFEKRKNQYRPAPHPTSLHPKLARAMINLSGAKKEITDPFCGSGGIIIEAGLIGLKTTGIDIDPIMIKRATKNTAHYEVKTTLKTGDCLKLLNKKTEAIITDLPYGKNSKAKELNELYEEFLKKAEKTTNKLIIATPSFINQKKIINKTNWETEKEFDWPLHKTLTKKIIILRKKQEKNQRSLI